MRETSVVMPIRILLVLPNLNVGGAERSALNVLKVMDKDEYRGYLSLVKKKGPLLEEVPGDVEIVEFPPAKLEKILDMAPMPIGKVLLTLMRVVQLRGIINDVRPDIILSFMPGTALLVSPIIGFSRRFRPRWIAREGNNTKERLNDFVEKPFFRVPLRRWVRAAFSRADHFIAISGGVKQGLVEHFGIAPADISIIYNPVDLEMIGEKAREPVSFPWPKEKVILGVGRLVKQKGFDILIRAVAKVLRKIPVKLIIVGSGEEKRTLETLARSLGIKDDVNFVGHTPNPWAYMARSDLFVLPSLWEGFGSVTVEAMACGVPVVAADCDYGPREIITNGKDGVLAPVRDVRGLSEAICNVLEDGEMSESFIKNGHRRAQDFDSKKIGLQYVHIFGKVLHEVA